MQHIVQPQPSESILGVANLQSDDSSAGRTMASSPSSVLFFLLVIAACCCAAAEEALPVVVATHHPVDPTCPPSPPPTTPAVAAAVSSSSSSSYGDGEPEPPRRRCQPPAPHIPVAVFPYDVDPMQFALNLEYTEAEFFLHAAYGAGLDHFAPGLALGGPPPVGARKACLDDVTWRIAAEFGLQEVGHIRAIQRTVGGIPRPKIDLSAHNFARVMDAALGYRLDPPFDPYADSLSFLLASYVIPYLGINGYVGTNPVIDGHETKHILAGLLGVEAAQDAVLRALLFERRGEPVPPPYGNVTVAEVTDRVSALRNRLGRCGVKDEGLTVPRELGAGAAICTNVLSADGDSLSYARTPAELLAILYLTGDERVPGGFYPEGANGRIAKSFLATNAKPHGGGARAHDEEPAGN